MSDTNPRAGRLLPAHYFETDQPADAQGRRTFTEPVLRQRIKDLQAAIAAVPNQDQVPLAWRQELTWRSKQLAAVRGVPAA